MKQQEKLKDLKILFGGLLLLGAISWYCDSDQYKQLWKEYKETKVAITKGANYVVFSNDGPYGVMAGKVCEMPSYLISCWNDSQWLGNPYMAANGGVSRGFRTLCMWPVAQVVVVALLLIGVILSFMKSRYALRMFVASICFFNAGLIIIFITLDLTYRQPDESLWFGTMALCEMSLPILAMTTLAIHNK